MATTVAEAGPGETRARLRKVKELGVSFGGFAVFAGLLVFFSIARPAAFPTFANASAILGNAAVLLILGAALTVVLRIGEFDLSFAAVIGLAGATSMILIAHRGWPVWTGLLAGVLVGMAVGFANGIAVAYGRAPAFIVTLAAGSVTTGLERGITGDNVIFGAPRSFGELSTRQIFGIPQAVYIAFALTIVIWLILRYTTYGRRVRAIGSNRRAAELAGIGVAMSRVWAFAIMGAGAGLAGVIVTSKSGEYYPSSGDGYLLPPYAAAFLGAAVVGRGRFGSWPTCFGVLFIGTLETGLTMLGQPSWLQQLIEGSVLLAAVLLARSFK